MNEGLILDIINGITFVLFIAMLALVVVRMTLRWMAYFLIDRRPSVILRRDLLLMADLLFVFGAPVVIQFFGWGQYFFEGGALRLPYTIVRDVIGLAGLAYWTWAEYFVIGRPGRENF
jgi:hypothetical protein